MEWLSKLLFDFDKLPSKFVMIIFFLTGIILFVPNEFLAKVKLNTFNDSYGHWVGIGFISSTAFLAVTFMTYVSSRRKTIREEREKKARRKEQHEQIEKEIRSSLHRLDPVEQSILREFYLVGSTVNLPMNNASVVGLQDKHILRLAQSNLGTSYLVTGNFELPYMLTDFARSVIESNVQQIGLPMDPQPTQAQLHKLAESRPSWIRRDFGYY
jgi:hypothetical protein